MKMGFLPEVGAQVKAGTKRPVTDNCSASSSGRQEDSEWLTVLYGNL